MNNKPKIAVIMSTYNGEKYLKEQLNSVLAQTNVDLDLFVFDDCSTDQTVNIIESFQQKHKNIYLKINEKNKNFTYNFLDGLFSFKDNQDYEYYAFADQDDYWLQNKLEVAIDKIKQTDGCTLYCSNLKVVDENLIYANNNMLPKNYKNNHYDVLCKNIVTGCTIVMDNKFKDFATKHYPQDIYLHDHWLAAIANYCKDTNFVYDENPDKILYRQHNTNLIGSNKKVLKKLKKKTFQKSSFNLMKQFYELYKNHILEDDLIVFKKISKINKLKNKLYLFFKIKSNFSLVFKIKLLLNNY